MTSNPSEPLSARTALAAESDPLRLSASRAEVQEAPLPPAAPASLEPPCDRSFSAVFCVYTVQPGDTLSKIATQFGLVGGPDIANWQLLAESNRPDIVSDDDFIQAGQKLRVPLQNGIVHVVLVGDSLSQLAAGYGVDSGAVVTNAGTPAPATLTIGQELLITNPKRIPAPTVGVATLAIPSPTPEPSPAPTETPAEDEDATATPAATQANATAQASATPAARATRTPTPGRTATPAAPSRSSAGFIWPTTGPISSYFGPSHPLGIDIDLYANPNAPVVAAAAGTVTFVGGNTCCSYGLYVIIEHANGYTTLYAHLSRFAVSQGQQVSQGQLLGYGGRTGYATGNHLHFEVWQNGTIINPLSVLP
jgi:murein DD-endopeptidase MepM/ murein hydrolase activator NlpD